MIFQEYEISNILENKLHYVYTQHILMLAGILALSVSLPCPGMVPLSYFNIFSNCNETCDYIYTRQNYMLMLTMYQRWILWAFWLLIYENYWSLSLHCHMQAPSLRRFFGECQCVYCRVLYWMPYWERRFMESYVERQYFNKTNILTMQTLN